jgi:type II secretory ATPase GspE/PulE/Tfp pilus assembly ATPase PilB-like protein
MGVVMRVRKDGILQTVIVFDHAQFQKYLMKIKYIAGVKMNIEAQTQDGRFDFDLINNGEKVKVDVRVSVMPSLRGESLVLRFLDSSKGMLTFEQL